MVRVRIDLAYDGEPFHGFARQRDPTLATVQGTLETAVERLVGDPTPTTAAGRTDRGVHALAQVVHLDLQGDGERGVRFLADLDGTRRRLDRLVGDAITIWRVQVVGDGFHARFSATERRYRYRLVDAPAVDPFRRRTRWHVPGPLAVRRMRAAARHLLGEHDFASFCRRPPGKHTIRRIDGLTVARDGDEIHVRLRGPAFCHQQVRAIVGCLVTVGRGDRAPGWVAEVLAARDRGRTTSLAPPHGLVLERVSYGRAYPAAPPRGSVLVRGAGAAPG